MNKILITILIITGFLIYKMISSSRRQEGYKRWKATGGGKEEKVDKTKWERGSWLRHAMGVTTPVAPYTPRFEKEAVIWCAALLGVEVNRLEEILNNVSGHYQEFWMRKRSGGYRMISAPDKDLQAIQSQLDEIRNRMQGQQKHIEDTKKIVLETYRCFKVMIDALGSCKTDKEEATPLPLYQRIYNKVASWICPGLFLFSAVLVICFASIFLNVCLAERMQQLQDNDMKYRYLLMQGQADGETFDMLENKFKWQRDNGFIRSLTDSVIDFEYRIQKQAEALERARLLNEQAEQLKKEADKLGKP